MTTIASQPARPSTTSYSDRDRLVIEHLSLVRAIAVRVYESLPVHVELDDLVDAGFLGLLDAAVKYDSDKQITFKATPNTGSKVRFSTACAIWTGRRAICENGTNGWK
jgi:hypothetical protein